MELTCFQHTCWQMQDTMCGLEITEETFIREIIFLCYRRNDIFGTLGIRSIKFQFLFYILLMFRFLLLLLFQLPRTRYL